MITAVTASVLLRLTFYSAIIVRAPVIIVHRVLAKQQALRPAVGIVWKGSSDVFAAVVT